MGKAAYDMPYILTYNPITVWTRNQTFYVSEYVVIITYLHVIVSMPFEPSSF